MSRYHQLCRKPLFFSCKSNHHHPHAWKIFKLNQNPVVSQRGLAESAEKSQQAQHQQQQQQQNTATHHPEVLSSGEHPRHRGTRGRDLSRYDPWENFLPSNFFGPRGFLSDMFERSPRSLLRNLESTFDAVSGAGWNPRVDVVENKGNYLIHAEIPGVPKENVKIDIKEDVLTIKGERQDTIIKKDEKTQDVIHRERFYGTFLRSFSLPENVDSKNIKASFKDGVLELNIPKKEVQEENVIEVKID
jgi:HSP20 family protein